MLSDEECRFLSERMKISVSHVEEKLSEVFLSGYRAGIEEFVSFCVKAIRTCQLDVLADSQLVSGSHEVVERINKCAIFLQGRICDQGARDILDAFRHAFRLYALGGLHDLWVYQENEMWYPKIILDCELKPNCINLLPGEIVIYRGASISEWEVSRYGQSWSTEEAVARRFAYQSYEHMPWFKREERVVFRTTVNKSLVFYACQAPEYEVVVDSTKIGCVELLS
ncbi:hypothetical protein AAZU54_24180 [Pseudomonas sp. Je.1.5.c]|uniref:hypothetical protein n=1 Tax=Pseudomonas sp. Je.1.5.c TaxID=3142839 RepID=UPI003DA7C301